MAIVCVMEVAKIEQICGYSDKERLSYSLTWQWFVGPVPSAQPTFIVLS